MAKNTDEPYGRSILQDKQDLPELESCGGCCVFSGSFRVMQRPELGDDEKTRGDDGGGARAEERWHEEEDGEEVAESPSGRPIYKARS